MHVLKYHSIKMAKLTVCRAKSLLEHFYWSFENNFLFRWNSWFKTGVYPNSQVQDRSYKLFSTDSYNIAPGWQIIGQYVICGPQYISIYVIKHLLYVLA